jgi:hypothetical protein
MVVSSRTPEGSPNRCPVCGSFVRLEPSLLFGDAPCPACGQLLWFVALRSECRYLLHDEAGPIRERVIDILCENLGVNKEAVPANSAFLRDIGADSLDIVELVMELEKEFG